MEWYFISQLRVSTLKQNYKHNALFIYIVKNKLTCIGEVYDSHHTDIRVKILAKLSFCFQICNWFANWRRKLKNVNADRNQQTWGHLIRTYNDRAQGNVEQFSICSDDSIWSEPGPNPEDTLDIDARLESSPESNDEYHPDTDSSLSTEKCESFNNNSNEIDHMNGKIENSKNITSPLLLSKWLESAARFQPSETNYSWWGEGRRRKIDSKSQLAVNNLRHDRDEVEAAVALTALASATSRVTAP